MIVSSIAVSSALAQTSGVKFRDDYWLEKAIQIAKIEDKNIFIDTYAPWCGPCKLMDIQFQDEDLGAYFNEKYISIKINMDSEYGEAIRAKYDVFFLPTLLILDKYGNAKYTSEGTLTADELLAIGSHHYDAIYRKGEIASAEPVVGTPAKTIAQNTTSSNQTPGVSVIQNKATALGKKKVTRDEMPFADKPVDAEPEETILYTENQASENPDYLYNLTYLKLQLQDGSQWQAANNYLATQENWSTERNMRFIFDFVRKPGTKMFQHILDNKEAYYKLFNKENVDRSISIMTNLALYQGYPRPEKEEALELFQLLDAGVAEVATYKYILDRYEQEKRYDEFVWTGLEYLAKYDSADFLVVEKVAEFYEESGSSVEIGQIIELTENAIVSQGGTYYKLFDVLANLYYQDKSKRKALEAIRTAKELAIANAVDIRSIEKLEQRIENM